MSGQDKKRCETCECYECDCEIALAIAIIMIEFLLIFMIDDRIVNQTQRFKSVDDCLYFAERLTRQPAIPHEDGNKKITAYCKPINR